jgi:hypothetical protein
MSEGRTQDCLSSFIYNERQIGLQTNPKFKLDRALVYTFEGELFSHR